MMTFDSTYDRLPYTNHAYAESHPDRLRTVALLSGWAPPALTAGSVLEIGCGRGGNLLAMAASLPGARLVGVERSERQAAEARTVAERVGVKNVTVHAGSFTVFDQPEGTFDYIVAHGIASWIPPEDRRALLRRIAGWLSPSGVAYVSFNALPGWYEQMAARDWLRFAASEDGKALGIVPGAASLEWLRAHVSPERGAYREGLANVRARLEETSPAYLFHEYLEGNHHPQRVADLLEEADAAGLAYLGDAIQACVALETLLDPVRLRAEGLPASAAQQLVDFIRGTAFRRALFVRRDSARTRDWRWPARLDATAVRSLSVASRLRPSAPDRGAPIDPSRFDGPHASVQVPSLLAQTVLHELYEASPSALPFPELAERATRRLRGAHDDSLSDLASEILDLWLSVDGLDLCDHSPAFTTLVRDRPKASPLARYQAMHGGPITNLWHQEVILPEAIVREVLLVTDGTRTVAELAKSAHADPDVVSASLLLLARSALLVE